MFCFKNIYIKTFSEIITVTKAININLNTSIIKGKILRVKLARLFIYQVSRNFPRGYTIIAIVASRLVVLMQMTAMTLAQAPVMAW